MIMTDKQSENCSDHNNKNSEGQKGYEIQLLFRSGVQRCPGGFEFLDEVAATP